MIAAGAIAATIAVVSVVGVAIGQPFLGVPVAAGLLIGYACALRFGMAQREDHAGAPGPAIDDATMNWSEFHRELTRARRFDRPFALIRLRLADTATAKDLTRVRDRAARATRRIDRVWINGDHVLMLLPEASVAAVDATLARVRAAAPEAFHTEPGIALFPQHGITSGSLIAAAYGAGVEGVPTPITTARPYLRSAVDAGVVDTAAPAEERVSSGG